MCWMHMASTHMPLMGCCSTPCWEVSACQANVLSGTLQQAFVMHIMAKIMVVAGLAHMCLPPPVWPVMHMSMHCSKDLRQHAPHVPLMLAQRDS